MKASQESNYGNNNNDETKIENVKSPSIPIPKATRGSTHEPRVKFDRPYLLPEKLEEKEKKNYFFTGLKLSPRKNKSPQLTNGLSPDSNSGKENKRSLTKRLSRTLSFESRDSQQKADGKFLNTHLKVEQNNNKETSQWTLDFDAVFKEDLDACIFSYIDEKLEFFGNKNSINLTNNNTHVLREETLTIFQYMEMKTAQIHKIQNNKINLLKELVTLFNTLYKPEEHTLYETKILKGQIKTAVELSLCATRLDLSLKIKKIKQDEGYYRHNSMDSIQVFWIDLICYLPNEVYQDYKNKVDILEELMQSLFPLVNELEFFQTEILPFLGKYYHTPYFVSVHYLTELCEQFLKQELSAQFVDEYIKYANISVKEFICIRDLFLYIEEQKEKLSDANTIMLALVETILKNTFAIPYQRFCNELRESETVENTSVFGSSM